MKNYRCLVLFGLLLACVPSLSTARTMSLDWWQGSITTSGLAPISPTAGQRAEAIASDVAVHDARLHMRHVLYRLPVTEQERLGMVLLRFPTLPPLIERELAQATQTRPIIIQPDLIEVSITVPLANFHRLLAAVLLGKEDPRPSAETATKAPAAPVVIVPPASARFSPGLLPLFGSLEVARSLQLRRLLARFLIDGGTVDYITPAAAASLTKRGARRIEATALGGMGSASLVFTDQRADELIEVLRENEGAPKTSLAIVLKKPSSP